MGNHYIYEHMKDLNALFAERFQIAAADVTDSLSPKDVPEWDSMNFLLFIVDVEERYGISFSMDEVLNSQTLGDIRKALQSKSVNV